MSKHSSSQNQIKKGGIERKVINQLKVRGILKLEVALSNLEEGFQSHSIALSKGELKWYFLFSMIVPSIGRGLAILIREEDDC